MSVKSCASIQFSARYSTQGLPFLRQHPFARHSMNASAAIPALVLQHHIPPRPTLFEYARPPSLTACSVCRIPSWYHSVSVTVSSSAASSIQLS